MKYLLLCLKGSIQANRRFAHTTGTYVPCSLYTHLEYNDMAHDITHRCHCSTDAIANAATNTTAATHHPPKLPPMLRCYCFNRCCCTAGAAFVFTHQYLAFALAGFCVAYSCTTSLPLDV